MKPRISWLWLDPPKPNDGTNDALEARADRRALHVVGDVRADVRAGAGDEDQPIVEMRQAAGQRRAWWRCRDVIVQRSADILEQSLVRALVEIGEPDAVLAAGRQPLAQAVEQLGVNAVDPAAGQEQSPGGRSWTHVFS